MFAKEFTEVRLESKSVFNVGINAVLNRIWIDTFGLTIELVDMTNFELLQEKMTPETKLVWIETPTNPTLKLIDISAVVRVVTAINPSVVTVVDNTLASPYNQSPILLGATVSLHSLTKYIGGHSDIVGGSISTNNKEIYERL